MTVSWLCAYSCVFFFFIMSTYFLVRCSKGQKVVWSKTPTNLGGHFIQKHQHVESWIIEKGDSVPDNRMETTLSGLEQRRQPGLYGAFGAYRSLQFDLFTFRRYDCYHFVVFCQWHQNKCEMVLLILKLVLPW